MKSWSMRSARRRRRRGAAASAEPEEGLERARVGGLDASQLGKLVGRGAKLEAV